MSYLWRNVLLILGSTVGAGIFSLPQILHSIGLFWFSVFLIVVGFVMYRVNWFYFTVIREVKGKHQFSGYVEKVLGHRLSNVAVILHLFSTYGALIAFVLIGGEFLAAALGLTTQLGIQIFYIFALLIMFLSRNKSENVDEFFTMVKAGMFVIIVFLCLQNTHSMESWTGLLGGAIGVEPEAVGAFVFALTGFSIIPELHKSAGKKGKRNDRKSLLYAQLIIMAIYFMVTIALYPFWEGTAYAFANPFVEKLFSFTGFVSVFTAYLLLTWVAKDLYVCDLKVNNRLAMGLVLVVPLIFIFFQLGTFLTLLSFTGGVFLAGTGVLICWMYRAMFPEKHILEGYIIQFLLFITMGFEIYNFLVK